jgi:hypothetical protein
MIDCSLYELSSKISADNMNALASNESLKNYYSMRNFLSPAVSQTIPYPCSKPQYYYDHSDTEHSLMKGFQVHKKTCIFKRPEFNKGSWIDQMSHRILPVELENKFDIKTKAKSAQN